MHVHLLISSMAFLCAQSLGLVAGVALQVIVARQLMAADYGRFVVAGSVLLMLTLGLVSAVPKALARIVSIDAGRLPEAWRRVWVFQVPLCLSVAAVVVLAASGGSLLFDDRLLCFAFAVIAVELVLRAGVLEPGWALLNGSYRHRTQAGLMFLHSILRVVCVGLAIMLLDVGLLGCLFALAGSALLSSLTLIPVIQIACRKEVVRAANGELLSGKELLRWIRWAPAAEVLNYLIVAVNLWMFKALSDDPAAVGLYAACFSLAAAVMPLGIAVSRGTFASFAAMIAANRLDEVSALLRQVLQAVLIVGSCGVCVAYVLGTPIIALLFGDSYPHQGYLLGMLVTGTFGIALVWMLGDVLNAAGALRGRLVLMVGVSLFSIVSTMLMVPAFGVDGAAMAMLVTGVAGALAMGGVVAWMVPGSIPVATLARTIVAGALNVGVCDAWLVPGSPVWTFGCAFGVCGVQLGILSLVGQWRYRDLAAILNRPKLFTSSATL